MTPKEQKLYDWVSRVGCLLVAQAVGSGYNRQINNLLSAGKLEIVADPHVKDAGGCPAASLKIREAAIN